MLFIYLLSLFVILPVCELWLLFYIADTIGNGGGFITFGLVIFTGMIGANLARGQGVKVFTAIQRDLSQARMPTDHLISGLFVLMGGVMLITPGIITDITGLFLMIPGNRRILIPYIKKYFAAHSNIKMGPLTNFCTEKEVDSILVENDDKVEDDI